MHTFGEDENPCILTHQGKCLLTQPIACAKLFVLDHARMAVIELIIQSSPFFACMILSAAYFLLLSCMLFKCLHHVKHLSLLAGHFAAGQRRRNVSTAGATILRDWAAWRQEAQERYQNLVCACFCMFLLGTKPYCLDMGFQHSGKFSLLLTSVFLRYCASDSVSGRPAILIMFLKQKKLQDSKLGIDLGFQPLFGEQVTLGFLCRRFQLIKL